MEIDIGLIGSVASIIGIPLSILLYFLALSRNKLKKGKEIIENKLLHHLSRNNDLTSFAVRAVVNTVARQEGINPRHIKMRKVIERLTVLVMTQGFSSARRDAILSNLENIHRDIVYLSF